MCRARRGGPREKDLRSPDTKRDVKMYSYKGDQKGSAREGKRPGTERCYKIQRRRECPFGR